MEWYDPWCGMTYDIVYVSKVFSFSPDYCDHINARQVIRGGTGYAIRLVDGREVYDKSMDADLPADIEHVYPDYTLYPTKTADTAYGFLTRGCPRGCSFCIVGGKEGLRSRKVADLQEFWRGQKNIVLSDPNILACPEWGVVLEQLKDSRAMVDFNQGLDIRVMTEAKVRMLQDIRWKEIHFAWDRYEDKDKILPKFRMFAEMTKRRANDMIVFTITNYDTTLEQDLERIYTLRELGFYAYVTIYDKAHCKPIYRKLQRWCNNRFIFSQCERFEDFDNTNRRFRDDDCPTLFE